MKNPSNLIQVYPRKRIFHLTWVINNICTNHCAYCPPILHAGTNHGYQWKNAKTFIERLINERINIHCAVTGGEPTVSPFFKEMVEMFHSSGNGIGVTSNGSKSLQWWSNISKKLMYVCFSYHPSYHDEAFFDKAVECANHTPTTVRIMMDSRHWELATKMYDKFAAVPSLTTEPVLIQDRAEWFRAEGCEYEQYHLDWFKDHPRIEAPVQLWPRPQPFSLAPIEYVYNDGRVLVKYSSNDVIIDDDNHFKGWSCNIGLESLFVSHDGFVKRANCTVGGGENQYGHLFHLDDHENHILPNSGVICDIDSCSCTTDIAISKSFIDYDA